jgi:hypothetical protein
VTLNLDALGYAAVVGLVAIMVKLLLARLDGIEHTLSRHGMKLVRIETKLGIPDNSNGDS